MTAATLKLVILLPLLAGVLSARAQSGDPRIDIAETETMVKALRANGIDAPYIRFPDEGHGWRKLSNRLFYFRRQAQFLEAVLLDQPPDRWR